MSNAEQSFLIVNEFFLRCLAVVDASLLRPIQDPLEMGFEWWKFHPWISNAEQSFLILNECYLRCLEMVDAPPLRLNLDLDPNSKRISNFSCKIGHSKLCWIVYILLIFNICYTCFCFAAEFGRV